MLNARVIEGNRKRLNSIAGQVIVVDICNTLADINSILDERLGPRPSGVYYHPALADEPDYFEKNLDIFVKAQPIRGAAKMLNYLSRINRIVYATARPRISETVTKAWLKKHGFPAGPVLMDTNKMDACQRFSAKFAIEDCPENINRLRDGGVEVFVVKQDYNETLDNCITW